MKSLPCGSNITHSDATLVDSFISRIDGDECGIILVLKAGRKKKVVKTFAISE